MKKSTALVIAGIMAASLFAGCGQEKTGEASSASVSESTSVSSTQTSEGAASSSSAEELETVSGSVWTYDECLTLPDYEGLELTKTKKSVTDQDVKDYYSQISQPVELTDPDAVVENGDILDTTYQFKIGEEDYNEESPYSFKVGAHSNIDGFEEGMIGHKAGDDVYMDLQFPDDYWSTDVAGLPATFHVHINSISRTEEPTDEFVDNYTSGEYKTVDEYNKYIRDYLERSNATSEKAELRTSAWEYVYTNTEFKKIPQELIDKGLEVVDEQMKQDAQLAGYDDVDKYLEESGADIEAFEQSKKDYAEMYAKNLLIIGAIWEKEGLKEDGEIYTDVLQEIADASEMTVEELKAAFEPEKISEYCKSMAANDAIVSHAKITEKEEGNE